MIIGLSGYARSGKDTAAKGLEAFGFQRIAFADKLREFLLRLNPTVIPRNREAFAPSYGPLSAREVINDYGWDGYKASPYGEHMREYLQRLGTECGRELISDTIWIDAALPPKDAVGTAGIVVTDVRFPNEAGAIKDRGGYIVRIERPGTKPANPHVSEIALDNWIFDSIIDNDGTETELHEKLANIALYFAL